MDRFERTRIIAARRIAKLLELARSNPQYCHRYAELAWKMYIKHRPQLPNQLKRQICRGCHGFLIPGRSLRVRLVSHRIVLTCLRCGRIRRIPY